MDPWYKVATPRKEVREGRSFNPDEFAIALEQVVAGMAPDDSKKPDQFFARTCFTRAFGAQRVSGAWPLASLRQSFLSGSLTRVVDPDAYLKSKIVEFVSRGEFGLASGAKADGSYERLWFEDMISSDEVAFDSGVFLLRRAKANALKSDVPATPSQPAEPEPESITATTPSTGAQPSSEPAAATTRLRLVGSIPPEIWNRLGTRILPKLRSGSDLKIGLEFSVTVKTENAGALASELRQILQELGLAEIVRVE